MSGEDRILEKFESNGRWRVTALALNGVTMTASGKSEEEAIEKALRAEPDPA